MKQYKYEGIRIQLFDFKGGYYDWEDGKRVVHTCRAGSFGRKKVPKDMERRIDRAVNIILGWED
jgi:hypothetical protein